MIVNKDLYWAAVVAQRVSTGLPSKSLEILGTIPDRLIFLSSPPQYCILNQVPQQGATLLFFYHKNRCVGRNKDNMHRFGKNKNTKKPKEQYCIQSGG